MKGYCRIHAIANCEKCDWREEDYRKAQRAASIHNKKTGHKGILEVGYFKCYENIPDNQ